MKNEKLQQILKEARADIEAAQNSEDISNCRNKYLAKKSELSGMMSVIGTLPPEERKDFGAEVNAVKVEVAKLIEEKGQALLSK